MEKRRVMVDNLVEQLICNDEVVSEGLLLQLVEVVHKDLAKLVQKQQHGGRIDIFPRDNEEVEV